MPKKTDVVGTPNEVFQQIPRSNPVQDDFGWTVPIELIPLPSSGKVYPPGSSLHGKETIQIKAMTAQEEDILLSRALIKDGTVLTHLLASCITDKSINPKDMVAGDRSALLVAIRVTGYGAEYRADISCPACETRQSAAFDLTDMPIKRLAVEPIAPGTNQFDFMLPISKKRVTFKLMTGRDEEEANLIMERRKKLMPEVVVDNVVTTRLESTIVAIDGISDRNKIAAFIRAMPAHDSRKLREYMTSIEPGIEMTGPLHCSRCSVTSQVSLPIGISFFWPST